MIGRPLSPVSFAGARRRGRRRGLIVGAAAGAAVAHHNNNNQAEAYEEQPAPVMSQDDKIKQLQQLATLKEQGILTDEEFAQQKAQILGS